MKFPELILFLIGFICVAHGKPLNFTDEVECPGYNGCHKVYQDQINVHLIPHSHDDVGWLDTVDQYYFKKVQYIISSVVTELLDNPERRFIQVETAYFYMWWKEQNDNTKSQVIQLINEGRLEIANGAWSMNDEAAVHYQSTMDQYTLGLRFIEDVLGKCARPKVGWQIDPFGHSNEHASLLSQMGLDSVFFSRIDHRDKDKRKKERTMDLLWRGSANLGNKSSIFTSVLYSHYNAPDTFCFDVDCGDPPIVTNTESPEYNWEDRVNSLTKYIAQQAATYPTNNILVTIGGDMKWRNAQQVFVNLDKLIAGFKKFNPKIDDQSINLIYSTPACYAKAVRDSVEVNKIELTTKTDDFFPYSDGGNTVWTGYFSSRPTSKRLERFANNLHQVSKQITAIGGKPYGAVSRLSQALGVMQHHDAITGTEKTAVEKDYHRQIIAGMNEAIEEISNTLGPILNLDSNLKSCLLSNVSICTESTGDKFTVLIYNPLARSTSHYIQIPVNDGTWKVTDPSGDRIENVLTDPVRDFSYITHDNTNDKVVLPKVLNFKAEDLPALGYKAYTFERISSISSAANVKADDINQVGFEDRYVNFDLNTGLLKSITLNGFTLKVSQKLMFYNGSADVSGAYIFRPDTEKREAIEFGDVTTIVAVNEGNLLREIRQQWNDYATQIIRVYKDEDFVEFDWIVGPIDITDRHGREVITRYSTQLSSDGVFYTDSNGRELVYRKKDFRPTYEYTDEEPQSGNYYPVNSRIVVKDDETEFAVLTDRSEGGASLSSGEIELMLHRATIGDDHRGVGENLNESEYGRPLVARGSHYVTLGKSAEGDGKRTMAAVERDIAQRKHLQPWVFYTPLDLPVKEQSFLNKELPPNVHLLTLESWGPNSVLIRLEHFLEKSDDPELSKEVTVDLTDVFKTIKIKSLKEYLLAANTPLDESESLEWSQIVDDRDKSSPLRKENRLARDETDLKIALAPMQIRTFVATVE